MTREELAVQPGTRRLVQTILELTLVSHVSGTSYDSSGGGSGVHEISGAAPPGGVDHKGDRTQTFRQKSADVFARRLRGLESRCETLSDEDAVSIRDEILTDATAALRDWRKTPDVPGQDPDRGTFQWKCRVAEDERSSRQVATHYGVSHVSVLRWRQQYRGLRA